MKPISTWQLHRILVEAAGSQISPNVSVHTHCATASPPTFLRMAPTSGLSKCNYSPLNWRFPVLLSAYAKADLMTWKGFAPLMRAVSTVVRMFASAWAAHMARYPFVTFRWMTHGRSLRSDVLLVTSTSPG